MRSRDLVLTLVEACGASVDFGRTSLQKLAFFAAHRLDVDLRHRAHYYGPYSVLVEEDVASLVLGGLVEESMTVIGHGARGPIRRYRYSVTPEGRKRLELVSDRYPRETAAVHDLIRRVEDVAGSLEQGLLWQAARSASRSFSRPPRSWTGSSRSRSVSRSSACWKR